VTGSIGRKFLKMKKDEDKTYINPLLELGQSEPSIFFLFFFLSDPFLFLVFKEILVDFFKKKNFFFLIKSLSFSNCSERWWMGTS